MRYEFSINLDYGSNIEKAIDILKETMESIDGVLQADRRPAINIGDLNSSSYNLKIFYWLNTFDQKYSASNIRNQSISKAISNLKKAGFYLPKDIIEIKNYQDKEFKTEAIMKN